VGQNVRATQNPHYRQASRFDVAAVLLRPWLFDLNKEMGPRQSCANARFNPYDWHAAIRPEKGIVRKKVAARRKALQSEEEQQPEPSPPLQSAGGSHDKRPSCSRRRRSRSPDGLEWHERGVARSGEPRGTTWTRTRSEVARRFGIPEREAGLVKRRKKSQRFTDKPVPGDARASEGDHRPHQDEALRQRDPSWLELHERGRRLVRDQQEGQRGEAARGGRPAPKPLELLREHGSQPRVEQTRQSRTAINNKRKRRRAATAKKLARARDGAQHGAGRNKADRGPRSSPSRDDRAPLDRRAGARVPQRTVRGPAQGGRGDAAAAAGEPSRPP
jgi:hypothetical protein